MRNGLFFFRRMKKIAPALERRLKKAARAAAEKSYSPYSKFPVGAAILAGSGKVYSACNVENASLGLCNCAERAAIFAAVANGEREVRCVVVFTPTKTASPPCGACRQVIHEFGPQARILSICDTASQIDTTLDMLLPQAFTPKNLA